MPERKPWNVLSGSLGLPVSFPLNFCRLQDRPPLLDFGFVEGRERLRILLLAGRKLLAQIGEPLPDARVGGVPGLHISTWHALWMPKGTSNHIIAELD